MEPLNSNNQERGWLDRWSQKLAVAIRTYGRRARDLGRRILDKIGKESNSLTVADLVLLVSGAVLGGLLAGPIGALTVPILLKIGAVKLRRSTDKTVPLQSESDPARSNEIEDGIWNLDFAELLSTSNKVRRWGIALLVSGLCVGGYFLFLYDTTAYTPSMPTPFGYVGGDRVHNLGLQQNRLLGSIAGMVMASVGAIMLVLDSQKKS